MKWYVFFIVLIMLGVPWGNIGKKLRKSKGFGDIHILHLTTIKMFSKPVHLVLEGAELPLNMYVLYRYMFNLKRFCHSLLFFNIVKLLSICSILTISFMVTTQLRRSTLSHFTHFYGKIPYWGNQNWVILH